MPENVRKRQFKMAKREYFKNDWEPYFYKDIAHRFASSSSSSTAALWNMTVRLVDQPVDLGNKSRIRFFLGHAILAREMLHKTVNE